MSKLLYNTGILIPLYNNFCYLRKALDSIDIENLNAYVIICNDCSTENVESILFEFFKKFNKYPIIIDEQNHKIENNIKNKIHYMKHFELNRHISITRMDLVHYSNKLCLEWIGWLDPDDWVDKGYYNELISYEKECLEKGKKYISLSKYHSMYKRLYLLTYFIKQLKKVKYIYPFIFCEDMYLHYICNFNQNNVLFINENKQMKNKYHYSIKNTSITKNINKYYHINLYYIKNNISEKEFTKLIQNNIMDKIDIKEFSIFH